MSKEQSSTTFIYALIDPRNGYVKYVGKSDNPKKRFVNHLFINEVKTKKHSWIKSLSSKNLIPELLIIDEVVKSEWSFWETYYISLFKFYGYDLTNGTTGGDGCLGCNNGRVLSDSTREKIRQSKLNMSDEYRRKLSISNTGKRPTEKTLIKLKESHANQKNENLRMPIVQLDLSGNFIKEFESISEASRIMQGDVNGSSNLTACLKRKRNLYKGYKWEYSHKFDNENLNNELI